MYDFETERARLLALFPQLRAIAGDRAASLQRLDAAEQRLRDGRLTVVVCGEFKTGKSSLLNALLDQPELFPTDVSEATITVTTVEYGDEEHVEVALGEKGSHPEEPVTVVEIDRDALSEYVTAQGNLDNQKQVRVASIRLPNERLRSGMVLVDTPGVGGVRRAHTAATWSFMPSADAVVFVATAVRPITQIELDFVSKVAEVCDFIVIAVNMVDIDDELVPAITERVAAAAGKDTDDVVAVPVSAYAKLEWLESGEDADLELSNFAEFERQLWSALMRRRGDALLGDAAAEIERTAAAVLLPLMTERDALRQASEEERAALREQLADQQRRLKDLEGKRAKWRATLRKRIAVVERELRGTLEERLRTLGATLDLEWLESPEMLAAPDDVLDAQVQQFKQIVSDVSDRAVRRTAEVQADIAAETGLDITDAAFASLRPPDVPVHHSWDRVREDKQPGRIRRALRDIKIWLREAAFLGPLGIGTARDEVRRAKRAEHRDRAAMLRMPLRHLLTEQSAQARELLATTMRDFADDIENELTSRIVQAVESVTDAQRSLQEAARANEQEAAARLRQLDAPIASIQSIRDRATQVARTITQDSAPQAPVSASLQATAEATVEGPTHDAAAVSGTFADE